MQVIAGPSSIELAKEISELSGWDLHQPYYKSFSDGEQYMRLVGKIQEEVLIVQSLYTPQEVHLFQLLNLICTVKEFGAKTIHVFTPYLCYARADRRVLNGEAISAKTVLKLLESSGVDHLLVLDVHNPAIAEFTSMKFTNIFPTQAILSYFSELELDINDYQIMAPDEGAIFRGQTYASALGIPFSNLMKTRDPETGEVGMSIGEASLSKRKIIMIDDIMATGTSLEKAASLLLMYDVEEIHIFVAHALGTSAVDRLREIGNGSVVATTSIPGIIGKLSPAKDLLRHFGVGS
ncbi:MAG: ribose-phosphate pyrophosphokinase [Candidatus Heimdallarchaeota archaeon]|nr:ribose-phosphate pyrophosphokinase [Candidatus Heimdallarchaeota archaeon]